MDFVKTTGKVCVHSLLPFFLRMNTFFSRVSVPLVAAALALSLQACSSSAPKNDAMQPQGVMVGGAMMVPNLNIVQNAANASNVTTVVAAVKAAGLAETLSGPGPFTVFAPTNAAFEKLPAGTVDTLLKPENKAKLVSILTYHVVAGKFMASDLKDGMTLKTVNGQDLMISVKDGKVWINGSAMVETADVVSSNGVTHVIDGVVLPK
jgi:uncharacterized surface protein with fasciclin (FAS1) repeats